MSFWPLPFQVLAVPLLVYYLVRFQHVPGDEASPSHSIGPKPLALPLTCHCMFNLLLVPNGEVSPFVGYFDSAHLQMVGRPPQGEGSLDAEEPPGMVVVGDAVVKAASDAPMAPGAGDLAPSLNLPS